MSFRQQLTLALQQTLAQLAEAAPLADREAYAAVQARLSVPKHAAHGDYTSPVAIELGRRLKENPRALATRLAVALTARCVAPLSMLARVEVAGPGHLNLFVRPEAWQRGLWQVLQAPADALRSDVGQNQRVLLEFVSANPTGPLHVAHGRGAVFGDVVARLLGEAGFAVVREYYVNDMGHQTDVLAGSIYAHYLALSGAPFVRPDEYYPGDYVQDLATQLFQELGSQYADTPKETWLPVFRARGTALMLERIRADLAAFNVPFDTWVSEQALAQPAALAAVVERLRARGHVYQDQGGKTWFRSTTFGDDKDRVMLREDGRPTYFLSDVAYHAQKAERGFDRLVNVWGADHGGYLPRIHAAMTALGYDASLLTVSFIQMVSLSRGGQTVKMGKRLGTAVWLREIIDEAGRDATRYLFSTRRLDSQMDFDIDLARQKSLENPVYYAQMGHARLAAIGRKAVEQQQALPALDTLSPASLQALTRDDELALLRDVVRAKDVVADAAQALEPHQITAYVQEIIARFHSYYSRNKAEAPVLSNDVPTTQARLLMCLGLQYVLARLLHTLGVAAPEQMLLPAAEAGSLSDAD